MSEKNQVQHLLQVFQNVSSCIQTHLSNFMNPSPPPTAPRNPLLRVSSSASSSSSSSTSKVHADPTGFFPLESDVNKEKVAATSTKEELGRATWTFLHTLAAQYPDKPTRQQKRDVKELMAILSRMYPCKECADHFKEVLRANPVQAGSHDEFSQWLCHVHNVVNRSLGKPVFPCERVDGRWGKLECEQRACDVLGATSFWS